MKIADPLLFGFRCRIGARLMIKGSPACTAKGAATHIRVDWVVPTHDRVDRSDLHLIGAHGYERCPASDALRIDMSFIFLHARTRQRSQQAPRGGTGAGAGQSGDEPASCDDRSYAGMASMPRPASKAAPAPTAAPTVAPVAAPLAA